ncbi:hypothetical protein EXW32_29650 (plasmid) [Bacillus mycoides]|nr:hypothetical protein EXW32_29650 [Bacillus mycoides]
MIMNHSDFFDLLQSKEALPNNQELLQSFELLINGFIANEMPDLENSGYNGQAVCGVKLNGEVILSPLGDLFPDAFTKKETAPSQLSCSELAASEPQRVITNKFAAMTVAQFVNEIFDEGTVSNHYIIFQAQKAFMKAAPIEE